MAIVYSRQGKYELALEHYGKALVIRRAALGEEHPDVGDCYYGMANVYDDQGKHELALELYGKGLVVRRAALREEHPCVAECYHGMANVYKHLGKSGLALDLYKQALSIFVTVYGDHTASVTTVRNSIAELQQCDNLLEQATVCDPTSWLYLSPTAHTIHAHQRVNL